MSGKLGFIGWSVFAQQMSQIFEETSACVYSFQASEDKLPHLWTWAMDVDQVFEESTWIFIESSMLELLPLVHRIKLLASDQHLLVLLHEDLSFEALTLHINERKLIRCVYHRSCSLEDAPLLFCASELVSPQECSELQTWFEQKLSVFVLGSEKQLEQLDHQLQTAAAMLYLVLDALSDGGLQKQLPKALSVEVLQHALLGNLKHAQSSGKIPAALKDEVLRQSTKALHSLIDIESSGVRGVLMKALVDS